MYDTHCHLNFRAFANDYRNVIKHSLEAGMFLNIVGTQYETSRRAIEIAEEFKDAPVYASVGLHPSHLEKSHDQTEGDDDMHAWDYEKYKTLGTRPKIVAIGETGIDRFRLPEDEGEKERVIEKQRAVFQEHVRLANELQKPIIIHCRPSRGTFDTYENLLQILVQNTPSFSPPSEGGDRGGQKGVVHCFLGNWEIAEELLALGLYISFTGIITFKNADARLLEVVKKIPLERILIETDAPYLTPEPFRGKARCEPLHVRHVAEKIAALRAQSVEEIIAVTKQNGERLFLCPTS